MPAVIAFITLVLGLLMLIPLYRATEFFAQIPVASWLSMQWVPELDFYGFGVPLAGTLILVAVSLPLTVALGWALAFQTVHAKHSQVRAAAMAVMQTWASLPSVVIGVWAITALLPAIRLVDGTGYSLLAASLGLTVFMAPACALLFVQAYTEYRHVHGDLEVAYGMGSIDKAMYFLKGCRAEVKHVVDYTFCRLFGETMIVLMLSGNTLHVPTSPFEGVRTMTATVALEMAYASGSHELALYGVTAAAVVFLLTFMFLRRNHEGT